MDSTTATAGISQYLIHSDSLMRCERMRLTKCTSSIPRACLVVSAALTQGEKEREGEEGVNTWLRATTAPNQPYPEWPPLRFRFSVSLDCICGRRRGPAIPQSRLNHLLMSVLKASTPRTDCRTKLYPWVKSHRILLVVWLPAALAVTFGDPSIRRLVTVE